MPQFDTSTWPGQIFWLLVSFAVFYTLVARVFAPRIRGALDARRARIEGDMAEARRLRDRSVTEFARLRSEID